MRLGFFIYLAISAACFAGLFKNERTENMKKIKSTAVGCLTYSMDYAKMPAKLADIVPSYLNDAKQTKWTNPTTGKKTEFILCTDLKQGEKGILLVSPEPFKGERLTCWADGSVKVMKEMDFLKQAKKQGWKIFIAPETFTGKPELKKKVEKLIAQLGSDTRAERKAAKKELEELGVAIHPLLKLHLKTDDPEVKESLKAIMKAMVEGK
jgi:hypothetical protein